MRFSNKYIMFASAALMLASCDLDKLPEGQYVGDEQNQDIIDQRPNMAVAGVNAMAAKLNVFNVLDQEIHNDFGIAAVHQSFEQGGQDMPCTTSGYNWFGTSQNYSDRLYDSLTDELIWKIFIVARLLLHVLLTI